MTETTEKRSPWGRIALWTILILLVLGAGGTYGIYRWGEYRLARMHEQFAYDYARSVGETIAILGRDFLEKGDTVALQGRLDDIIRLPGIQSLTVIDPGRTAIVATDRKDLGRPVVDEAAIEALARQEPVLGEGVHYVPIMAATRRLATLRIEFDPSGGEWDDGSNRR